MEIRDAVEADAGRLADLADSPPDVMRNLVHDRTVRVATGEDATGENGAEEGDGETIVGFVSYDAKQGTVHVTQLAGSADACERLLDEPITFAEREHMNVELLVPDGESAVESAVEASGFTRTGQGPRFEGKPTVRYRLEPGRPEQ
ncbi:hypothetical protein EGH21_05965 [Halomicroarcula sp. F13]|uniref:N-acetyltransferase domain-containing protein n=1 Tax=Haloarcula rubra TaxID=2487747 RepID=A0AAW4PN40_9EURY|nr:hypothetical protein [Halomicroarcula rubra]MBX0322570.1 hypothetical protein [Halomicroarcula rubra]